MERLTQEEFVKKFNEIQDAFEEADKCMSAGNVSLAVNKYDYVIDEGRKIMLYTFVDDGATAYTMHMLNKSILNAAMIDTMAGCFDANLWAVRLNDIIDFYQKAKLNNKISKVSNYNFILYSAYSVLGISFKIIGNTAEAIRAFQKAVELGSQGARVNLGTELYMIDDYVGAFKMLDSVDILSPAVSAELLNNSSAQALGMLLLADMYLYGRGVKRDIEKSYNILQTSLNHRYGGSAKSVEDVLEMTRERLSHYKKGLFGGLRYV